MKKVVLVTGGFDPLHSGHLAYFRAAKELGDILVVGVNSDDWLTNKKGRSFMPWQERSRIVKNLRMVDYVIEFDDSDGSARHAIKLARQTWPDAEIIFANGGDRTDQNIPEMDAADDRVKFVFGVGGFDKANSSSWILEEWKSPKTERVWGYYRVLHQHGNKVKVKELTIDPGQGISMQYHNHRNEFWFVAQGQGRVYTLQMGPDPVLIDVVNEQEHIWIDQGRWHQVKNETDQPLKIIEIQYGDFCEESDIERKSF